MAATNNISDTVYKIGAVSKLTNIPVDTLRIWERRYSVVVPIRSKTSDRLYQTEDINRLTLLKMLVDKSHSIGTIAKLSNEQLSQRLLEHNKTASVNRTNNSSKDVNVVVIGEVLSLQIEHSQINNAHFTISNTFHNENDFINNNKKASIDILIVEYPAIYDDDLEKIEHLFKLSEAKQLLLIFGFTNSAAKKLLRKKDYKYIQAPVTIENFQREVNDLIEEEKIGSNNSYDIKLEQKAPAKTYNNKQLITLSSKSSTIQCECPQHLSTMIIKLIQFEVYSKECVSRYEKDAELHSMLGNMAGHARAVLEQALTKIVVAENLKLEE